MALPWHKGSHQLLTDGFAPPSERPRCCSQEAHPGSCRLVSAGNRKHGEAPWSGRLFWCQGEGGAPGPAAGAAAPCPSQNSFVCCFPEDRESPPPWSVSREGGILCPPGSQGDGVQRGPIMLPSFLLAGGLAAAPCPLPVPWERCHALPRRIPMLRGRAAPHSRLCPHSLGPGTSAGAPGRLWQRPGAEEGCAHSLQAGRAFRRNSGSRGSGTKPVPGRGWRCLRSTAGRARAVGRCVAEEGSGRQFPHGF